MHRRAFLSGAIATAAGTPALAQHRHHSGQFERLNQPGRIDLPELAQQHAVTDSPAPTRRDPGPLGRAQRRCRSRAPRWPGRPSARARCTSSAAMPSSASTGRTTTSTTRRATAGARRRQLPRGANHVGVAAIGEPALRHRRLHRPEPPPASRSASCSAPKASAGRRIRPLPRSAGAIGCIAIGDVIHCIGGADGDCSETRRSMATHLVYDPREDRFSERAADADRPRPHRDGRRQRADPRDRRAGRHLLHQLALPPRLRSAHGPLDVAHADPDRALRARLGAGIATRMFIMGGEGSNRVYGQNEAYDPATDRWEALRADADAAPRHGRGRARRLDPRRRAAGRRWAAASRARSTRPSRWGERPRLMRDVRPLRCYVCWPGQPTRVRRGRCRSISA